MTRFLLSVFLLLTPLLPANAQSLVPGTELHGNAQIWDGDSLRIGEHRIRLLGIDAPELDQICKTQESLVQDSFVPCGEIARDVLADFVEGEPISCIITDIDRFGRGVAECFGVAGSLNAAMAESGWALALPRYSDRFIADAAFAEQMQQGMWALIFHTPSDWRRGARW